MNKDDVIQKVKQYVAGIVRLKITLLEDKHVLKKEPLHYDNTKLVQLALSLRRFVKSIKNDKTVLASELKKKNFTVKNTYELILKKLDYEI